MANKMLIDASHPEETRVVVLRGNRVDEFDFESASKKQLRGNIYLAKVTRVEPSLQAAFVEYGGNRHGFLAFSEIHPDYYQIPVADRQALLEEEARNHADEDDEDGRPPRRSRRNRRNGRERSEARGALPDETLSEEAVEPGRLEDSDAPPFSAEPAAETAPATLENAETSVIGSQPIGEIASAEQAENDLPASAMDESEAAARRGNAGETDTLPEIAAALDQASEDAESLVPEQDAPREPSAERIGSQPEEDDDEDEEEEQVEQIGGDELEEMPNRVRRLRRQYKIQEVIKRRQVLLVQVVKEERGNKGAALTTYLSLAGRYSVLMPNTARGGGISRKITDPDDRRRLKAIVQELEVPEGMGVILRTAGASRTKQEVQRDFEYLLRMWETVRELTLKSSAPTLVYEEGSLIKRSIRDLYNKDIDEVLVAGEEGYAEARDFMRMLVPSQAKCVVQYKDPQPIFARYGVESQLDSMFSNQVTLRSGGYLVINQTEALVAIDVNSGRSTREHNIEDTALRTNLEAADEIARQLRLRDLAGLIVADFIDMEEHRNNRSVERRLKEALKNDRARIQVGRISHFGLLEMSRQRIRTGVLEGSTIVCPHCLGAGTVRSTASIALHVLRVLEDALIKNASFNITVKTRSAVALYILNQKRAHVRELEERFRVTVTVGADDALSGNLYQTIERGDPVFAKPEKRQELVRVDTVTPAEFEPEEEVEADEPEAQDGEFESETESSAEGSDNEEGDDRPKRRRRRRRRGRDREKSDIEADAPQPSDEALGFVAEIGGLMTSGPFSDGEVDESDVERESANALGAEAQDALDARRRRRRPRRGRGRPAADEGSESPAAGQFAFDAPPQSDERVSAEPTRAEASNENGSVKPVAQDVIARLPPREEPAQSASATHQANPLPELPEAEPPQQKRSGWWQRAKATFGGS